MTLTYIFVAMLVWQLTMSLLKYYVVRPTDTSITVIHTNKQPFPAITLCNLNPLRKKVLLSHANRNNDAGKLESGSQLSGAAPSHVSGTNTEGQDRDMVAVMMDFINKVSFFITLCSRFDNTLYFHITLAPNGVIVL